MKIGKIPEVVLKRSVFKQIKHRREEVLVRPGVGKDCSVIELQPDEVFVMSTDPITGTVQDIGSLAVHITSNDIASSGADMIGVMLSILLPDGARESDLREMMQDIEATCSELGIEVLGGHTEVTTAVNQPIITITGVGKLKKVDVITTSGMKPGDEIVMTKWAGLEGTTIIAQDNYNELIKKYTKEFIDGAVELKKHLSIVPEARIGKRMGATSMHDVTEGGIFGALWEIAEASNVGLNIDLKKILMKQETVEICEFYNLNPYLLISSGCLLISTNKGNDLVEALSEAGIVAAIIGKVTEGKERIIHNEDEKRYLEPPRSDELYRVNLNSDRK